jgi:hypothetical protein
MVARGCYSFNAHGAPPPCAAAPRLADSLVAAAAGALRNARGAPPPCAAAPRLDGPSGFAHGDPNAPLRSPRSQTRSLPFRQAQGEAEPAEASQRLQALYKLNGSSGQYWSPRTADDRRDESMMLESKGYTHHGSMWVFTAKSLSLRRFRQGRPVCRRRIHELAAVNPQGLGNEQDV